jgi:hypothetical protein
MTMLKELTEDLQKQLNEFQENKDTKQWKTQNQVNELKEDLKDIGMKTQKTKRR